ncbi:MAG: glutathione S-transferase family protein [Candidatus Cloacimonetes bacterium]|nr:glutathione S-transferase family protein [Candidatus Cloacimonadota bacterium]
MNKPHLYTNPQSRGRIVRWMLEEIGAPYDVTVMAYGETMKSSQYLQINPMGKVPALVHGNAIVTETAAICAYLAEAFPEAELGPKPSERAAYLRWLFFAAGPLESAITNQSMGFLPNEKQQGFAGYGNFTLVQDVLENAISQTPYITGERFTAADVYIGSQIGWGLQFNLLEKREAFIRYWEKLSKRPAHLKATELDDALIKAKG